MAQRLTTQSELARDNRVRVDPIKVSEFRTDCAELYSGAATKDERKDLYSQTSETKGPDRLDRARLISNAWLVRVPDKLDGSYTTTLIGTGIGSRDPVFTTALGMSTSAKTDTSGRIDTELKKLKCKRDNVDNVIVPSLDHWNGSNLIYQDNRGDREPICSNAEYYIHREEYDKVMAAPRSAAYIYRDIKSELEVLQGKLREDGRDIQVWDGDEIKVGEFLRVVRHGGVTPGYCSVYVAVNSEVLVISSLFFPTVSHINPQIQLSWGFNRNETFEAKEALLEECARNSYILLFPHDPGLTAGYVHPTRSGYALEKVGDILH